VETIIVVLPFLIQEQIAANKDSVKKRAWIEDNFSLNFTNWICKIRFIVFKIVYTIRVYFVYFNLTTKLCLNPKFLRLLIVLICN
jgi:hypothetical protein